MFTLVIWAVLSSSRLHAYSNWHPIAHNIQTEAICEKAALDLGVKKPSFRCIRTGY